MHIATAVLPTEAEAHSSDQFADALESKHLRLLFFRCNIQWTAHWDEAGMQAVTAAHLQPVLQADAQDRRKAQVLITQAVSLHNSRLAAGATPRHYVAFVQLCSKLYTVKRDELVQQQGFLKVINLSISADCSYMLPDRTMAISLSAIMFGDALSCLFGRMHPASVPSCIL